MDATEQYPLVADPPSSPPGDARSGGRRSGNGLSSGPPSEGPPTNVQPTNVQPGSAQPGDTRPTETQVAGPTRTLDPLRPNDPGQLGQYRLLHRLPGGSGESWLFLAQRLPPAAPELVVLKVLPFDAPELTRRRFEREVTNARRIRSSRVARVHAVEETDGLTFMVQQFAPGEPLSELLARTPDHRLDDANAHRLAVGLLEALDDVHAAHVQHRDTKPSNVIVGERGVTLVDFGISRHDDDRTLTESGYVVGTPRYISPERLEGKPGGPASDVFSWAVTVAEACSGWHPFNDGESALRTPSEQLRLVRTRIPDLAGVPRRLRPAVEAALAVRPEARPSVTRLRRILSVDVPVTRSMAAVIPLPPRRLVDYLSARELRELRTRAGEQAAATLEHDGGFAAAAVAVLVLAFVSAALLHLLIAE